MARIDGILKIVADRGGTELRVRSNKPAELSRDGIPITFTLPPMSPDMLRELVADLLSDDQKAQVQAGEELVFSYGSRGLGTFWFRMQQRESTDDGPADLELTGWPSDSGEKAPTEATKTAGTLLKPSLAVPPPAAEILVTAQQAVLPPTPAVVPLAPLPELHEKSHTPSGPLAALLYRAVQAGASDLHLSDSEPPTLRISGRLRELGSQIIEVAPMLEGLMTPRRTAQLRDSSTDIGLYLEDVGRFRCNVYRHAGGLAVAIRVLSRHPPELADLGLPTSLASLPMLNHGLVIVCGPTGSGKSTTLASMARARVRSKPTVLISLEEPIEYTIEGAKGSLVRQREVGSHVASFSSGIRDALREDPDVILIGEMRDPESISRALTAAETGHLVLTSLHSRTAVSAVERIVDAYPSSGQQQIRIQLADSLRAIVAQRLLPRADGAGRVVAAGIMTANHAVANLIREGKSAQLESVIQSHRHEGMVSMERSLADMVKGGLIRLEVAKAAANDPKTLASYLN
ncbi:MAG: twitching motility protein PilT [Myxococcota bacterium]|jgi:twitching motility protein PilT